MGCGESKIKRINLPAPNKNVGAGLQDNVKVQIDTVSSKVSELSDESLAHPNRLLSAIPVSDLGDSLDSRHLHEAIDLNQSLGGGFVPPPSRSKSGLRVRSGGDSTDSGDSGYDEYDEEYSHIITENSSAELVSKVTEEFEPVDLPELLVITGRACARILSGYQKGKSEEGRILEALREEGLLAKPKGKTAGGMSFEVVDSSIVTEKLPPLSTDGSAHNTETDVFVSSAFMPQRVLAKLENRRGTLKRPALQNIDEKLAIAEARRKELSEEKVKNVIERSGFDRQERLKSASKYERQKLFSASIEKRQKQLQEIRDRLKDKHRQNDMKRLRKKIQDESAPTPTRLASASVEGLSSSSYAPNMEPPIESSNIGKPIEVGGPSGFFDD